MIVPVVLAAGASSRMGASKALLPLNSPGDVTPLGLILETCRLSGLATAVVVVGANPRPLIEAVGSAALVIENPVWGAGRTSSIQAGLEHLPAEASGFLLWPVDVCLPGRQVVRLLQAAWEDLPAQLAYVPSHAGRRGHPLLCRRVVAQRLRGLEADQPAREVVRALHEAGKLAHVEVEDPSVLWNMNTPEEYEQVRQEYQRRH